MTSNQRSNGCACPLIESNGLFRVATRVLGGEEQRRLAVYADMTMSRQADKDPLESCSGLTGRICHRTAQRTITNHATTFSSSGAGNNSRIALQTFSSSGAGSGAKLLFHYDPVGSAAAESLGVIHLFGFRWRHYKRPGSCRSRNVAVVIDAFP